MTLILFMSSVALRMAALSRYGSGPRLFLATGLSNTMPSAGYSQFISLLAQNFTVYCYDSPQALDAHTMRRIAQLTQTTAYVGHSSLDPAILSLNILRSFVLLDPAAFPSGFDLKRREFVPQSAHVNRPVLTLDAEYAHRSRRPFIPRGFGLNVGQSHSEEFAGVGHADILDDTSATACHLIGIRGCQPLSTASITRRAYRASVSRRISRFLNKCVVARWNVPDKNCTI
jgi:hypothetical protein